MEPSHAPANPQDPRSPHIDGRVEVWGRYGAPADATPVKGRWTVARGGIGAPDRLDLGERAYQPAVFLVDVPDEPGRPAQGSDTP